jgi:hypothetical protein
MLKGHVTICKIYSDGTEEIVLDRANLTTVGLGYGLCDIIQGAGSQFTSDYAPYYFQLGTSTIDYDIEDLVEVATSSHFYQVSAPFDWTDYGSDTELNITKQYRGLVASCTDTDVTSPVCSALLFTSALLSSTIYSGVDEYFATVNPESISKVFLDAFEIEIILDENTANGKDITEIGLFSKNPKGLSQDSPLLMAYRKFTALAKTADFSVSIRWSIGFLGTSNGVDDYYTGTSLSVGRSVGPGLTTSKTTPPGGSPINY